MFDSGSAGDGASQHTGRPTIRDAAAPLVHSSLSLAMRVGAHLFFQARRPDVGSGDALRGKKSVGPNACSKKDLVCGCQVVVLVITSTSTSTSTSVGPGR
jgi:hypothetical protein